MGTLKGLARILRISASYINTTGQNKLYIWYILINLQTLLQHIIILHENVQIESRMQNMTKLRGLLVPSPLWNPCSYLNWRASVFRESRYSSHYMGWEVAWAMVFLSWKWSKYSPGEISVVIIILGWTKFELLEEKKKIINHSATPPYDHTVNAVTLLLLPL